MSAITSTTIDFNNIPKSLYKTTLTNDYLPTLFTNIEKPDLFTSKFTNLFNGILNGGFGGYQIGDTFTLTTVTDYHPDAATPANPVPEPSTIALLAGVLMLGMLVRKFGFGKA